MKIIEGMKRIKHLHEKAADLRAQVKLFCSDLDYETMRYPPDQSTQITEWLQSHADTIQEIARLRVAITRTNLATPVTIELNGHAVTKSIAEWIHRRKDLAKLDLEMWTGLGDRNLKEGTLPNSSGAVKEVRIRRYFDPRQRDAAVASYKAEPTVIDGHLEVVNAVTELIEREDMA